MKNFIQINIEYSLKEIEDLLICAFEGGSNYWYDELEPLVRSSTAKDASTRFYDDIITHGFKLKDKETGKEYRAIHESYKTGVEVMNKKFSRHFNDWRLGNTDAETGDVYLQCLLFGDVIYG